MATADHVGMVQLRQPNHVRMVTAEPVNHVGMAATATVNVVTKMHPSSFGNKALKIKAEIRR